MNCSFEKGPEVVLPLIMVSSAWALFNARSARVPQSLEGWGRQN
jgi:hypothetical protein